MTSNWFNHTALTQWLDTANPLLLGEATDTQAACVRIRTTYQPVKSTYDVSPGRSNASPGMSSTSTITDRFRSNISTSDYNEPPSYARPLPPLHMMYPDRARHGYETHQVPAHPQGTTTDRFNPISRTSRPMTVSSLLTADEPSIPNPSRYHPPSIQPPSWVGRNDHGDVNMTDSSPKSQTA